MCHDKSTKRTKFVDNVLRRNSKSGGRGGRRKAGGNQIYKKERRPCQETNPKIKNHVHVDLVT